MASNLRVDNIQPSVGMGIGIGTANGSVTFNADVTGGMNIATGLVGVGTDNPDHAVHLYSGTLGIGKSENTGYEITITDNNLSFSRDAKSFINQLGTGTIAVRMGSSNTEVAEFTSDGLKFPSGKGIDFSATSDATGRTSEVLDDYEEGSWTPDVSGGGVTWGNQTGSYVKIGKQVIAQFWLQASGTSSSSGGFSIVGLPFASGSYSDRTAGACRAYSLANFSGASGVIYWMGGATTSINIVAVDGNGLTQAALLDHNVWQNGAEIHCTIHYQTA